MFDILCLCINNRIWWVGMGWSWFGQYRQARMKSANCCLAVQTCTMERNQMPIGLDVYRQYMQTGPEYPFYFSDFTELIYALHHSQWFWVNRLPSKKHSGLKPWHEYVFCLPLICIGSLSDSSAFIILTDASAQQYIIHHCCSTFRVSLNVQHISKTIEYIYIPGAIWCICICLISRLNIHSFKLQQLLT